MYDNQKQGILDGIASELAKRPDLEHGQCFTMVIQLGGNGELRVFVDSPLSQAKSSCATAGAQLEFLGKKWREASSA